MARRGQTLTCSFCGKGRAAVRRLIAGPDVFICDACVTLCSEIIATEGGSSPPGSGARPATPAQRPQARRGGGWWRRLLPGRGRVFMGAPLG